MAHLLIVEDDELLRDGLHDLITQAGHQAATAPDGLAAPNQLQASAFDGVVLDLGLPKVDGMTVLRILRGQHPAMPVLILTARDALCDRVQGLDMGADDYMVKPFELPELLARLRALLRRSQAATSAVLCFGSIEMDTAHRTVKVGGHLLDVGPREWTVLEYLLLQAPKPAAKDKLLQALTGWDKEITLNAIEVYIHRLRKKIEKGPIRIATVRGLGYCLEKIPN